ncbi:MAG: hypothetical protein FD161_4930, partial [Limisphaerales bacterium]
ATALPAQAEIADPAADFSEYLLEQRRRTQFPQRTESRAPSGSRFSSQSVAAAVATAASNASNALLIPVPQQAKSALKRAPSADALAAVVPAVAESKPELKQEPSSHRSRQAEDRGSRLDSAATVPAGTAAGTAAAGRRPPDRGRDRSGSSSGSDREPDSDADSITRDAVRPSLPPVVRSAAEQRAHSHPYGGQRRPLHPLKIAPFNQEKTPNIHAWLAKLEHWFRSERVTDDELKARTLIENLDDAYTLRCEDLYTMSYAECRSEFLKRFSSAVTGVADASTFMSMKRKTDEKMRAWMLRLQACAVLAFAKLPAAEVDRKVIDKFVEGAQNKKMESWVAANVNSSRPITLARALRHAEQLEVEGAGEAASIEAAVTAALARAAAESKKKPQANAVEPKPRREGSPRKNRSKKSGDAPPAAPAAEASPPPSVNASAVPFQMRPMTPQRKAQVEANLCFNCGQAGHYSRYCPMRDGPPVAQPVQRNSRSNQTWPQQNQQWPQQNLQWSQQATPLQWPQQPATPQWPQQTWPQQVQAATPAPAAPPKPPGNGVGARS